MTALIISSAKNTMTSLEISKLTGKRHDHVVRDIKKMCEDLELTIPQIWGVHKNSQNKDISIANLTKDLSLTLVSGYNTKLRYAIIKRWEELEAKEKLPTTYIEAMEELIRVAKQNEFISIKFAETEKKLLEAGPKVEFAETFLSTDDEINFQDWANGLGDGLGRNTLFDILKFKRYLTSTNKPMQKYIDNSIFRVTYGTYEKPSGEKISYTKTLITKKGMQYFTKDKLIEWKKELKNGVERLQIKKVKKTGLWNKFFK